MGSCFSKHSASRKVEEEVAIPAQKSPPPQLQLQKSPARETAAAAPTTSHKPFASSPQRHVSPAYGPVPLPPAEILKEKNEKHNSEYVMPLNSPKTKSASSSPIKGSSKTAVLAKFVAPPSPASAAHSKKGSHDREEEDVEVAQEARLSSAARKDLLSQPTSKVASGKNSFSRDPSPVEVSQSISRARGARPASPLRRSPSVKEAQDTPHLTRSSSGKASSPSRGGLYAASTKQQLDKRDVADDLATKARPLHRRSSSRESLADFSVHKRSSSREGTSEFPSEARKPSPPKKTPLLSSTTDTSRLSKRSAGKEDAACEARPYAKNTATRKALTQESSSAHLSFRGRSPVLKTSNSMAHESENPPSNNRNSSRKKEKSPLRRTCNGMVATHIPTRITDRNADLSINSDTLSVCQFDHAPAKVKDVISNKPGKAGDRVPLKEISENVISLVKSAPAKHVVKESADAAAKYRDKVPLKEISENSVSLVGTFPKPKPVKQATGALAESADNEGDRDSEDVLKAKSENLILEGKSVLSVFKALEGYTGKTDKLAHEAFKDTDQETLFSPRMPVLAKEIQSKHLKLEGDTEKSSELVDKFQPMPELQRSRSTKRSCESFLFPDMQSLLMSDNNGMQFEGGLAMPASISKACSILRAVADLNMGTSIYSKKKEFEDEIEQPNLLSFQFRDSVTQKTNCKPNNAEI